MLHFFVHVYLLLLDHYTDKYRLNYDIIDHVYFLVDFNIYLKRNSFIRVNDK